jgi:hypothetical protein
MWILDRNGSSRREGWLSAKEQKYQTALFQIFYLLMLWFLTSMSHSISSYLWNQKFHDGNGNDEKLCLGCSQNTCCTICWLAEIKPLKSWKIEVWRIEVRTLDSTLGIWSPNALIMHGDGSQVEQNDPILQYNLSFSLKEGSCCTSPTSPRFGI